MENKRIDPNMARSASFTMKMPNLHKKIDGLVAVKSQGTVCTLTFESSVLKPSPAVEMQQFFNFPHNRDMRYIDVVQYGDVDVESVTLDGGAMALRVTRIRFDRIECYPFDLDSATGTVARERVVLVNPQYATQYAGSDVVNAINMCSVSETQAAADARIAAEQFGDDAATADVRAETRDAIRAIRDLEVKFSANCEAIVAAHTREEIHAVAAAREEAAS